ncbi:MAG: hypothetical protein UX37_C0017G0014 [Microgenomates group bacterium GW2011_GWA2_46_16]|nr:MAG: hypothetical protein UX37_C0017G0014 [Microgenomates group bacterium GW2011_GWA2_46_16]
MDELKQINLVESETIPEEIIPMEPKQKNKLLLPLILIGILAGLATGFFVAQKRLTPSGTTNTMTGTPQALTSATNVKVGDIFGSADEKTFRDQAEGILASGGIEGEGSHHIERGENKSQWVYVTSSVVDLDLLVGDRVGVWGETNQGKKAGWLMDVGRLKVLELNAAPAVDATGNQD